MKHIGIILDGNRRFAKRLLQKPWDGHQKGAENVENVIQWARELNIKELTLYAFSEQNFQRAKEEVEFLMKIFSKTFQRLIDDRLEKLNKNGIRINFIGRISKFPGEVHDKMQQLMQLTKDNKELTVNFAMAYGGREEIIDTAVKIAKEVKEGNLSPENITEEVFAKHLYLNSDPDFIIRTGGDRRTSNFLVWQSNYSEWFFLEKTWPEFTKEDLMQCIEEFEERERRFGK
ncbi:MAG: di-trans,poly-cis-decaprenylcistransferase [Nanoarchaeota archaeon]|nr:di-trans,poly-cis-decaprenylcistransferase [Nanoarchaeota archaeon]